VSKIDVSGDVYKLDDISQFSGPYAQGTGQIGLEGIVTPRRTCGPSGDPVASGMEKISYAGYRFPPEIIDQAIWLYLRFTLSLDLPVICGERFRFYTARPSN
jgi:hypothetical protein